MMLNAMAALVRAGAASNASLLVERSAEPHRAPDSLIKISHPQGLTIAPRIEGRTRSSLIRGASTGHVGDVVACRVV